MAARVQSAPGHRAALPGPPPDPACAPPHPRLRPTPAPPRAPRTSSGPRPTSSHLARRCLTSPDLALSRQVKEEFFQTLEDFPNFRLILEQEGDDDDGGGGEEDDKSDELPAPAPTKEIQMAQSSGSALSSAVVEAQEPASASAHDADGASPCKSGGFNFSNLAGAMIVGAREAAAEAEAEAEASSATPSLQPSPPALGVSRPPGSPSVAALMARSSSGVSPSGGADKAALAASLIRKGGGGCGCGMGGAGSAKKSVSAGAPRRPQPPARPAPRPPPPTRRVPRRPPPPSERLVTPDGSGTPQDAPRSVARSVLPSQPRPVRLGSPGKSGGLKSGLPAMSKWSTLKTLTDAAASGGALGGSSSQLDAQLLRQKIETEARRPARPCPPCRRVPSSSAFFVAGLRPAPAKGGRDHGR